MIMSAHDPIRKRNMQPDNLNVKRARTDADDPFADKMYSLYVKSAMESLEKVC